VSQNLNNCLAKKCRWAEVYALYATALRSEGSETKSAWMPQVWPLLTWGLAAVMILVAVLTIHHRYPVAYVYMIHEDGPVENSTVIALALAAALLIWESLRPGHSLRRSLMIAVAAAALLVAGEEISWGQRIFGIDTPEALRVVNDQGELNFHNLEGVNEIPKYRPLGGALLIGLAASIALHLARRRSDAAAIIRALPLLQPALTPLILLTAWILAFLPFVRSDELGEWLLSLCLLAWATTLVLDRRPGSHRLVPTVSLGALAGVVLLGAGLAAAFPPQNPGFRLSKTAKIFANYGLYEQSLQVFEYVLAHPHYVQSETLAEYEAVRLRSTR
jgi:hypothetical protein